MTYSEFADKNRINDPDGAELKSLNNFLTLESYRLFFIPVSSPIFAACGNKNFIFPPVIGPACFCCTFAIPGRNARYHPAGTQRIVLFIKKIRPHTH